MLFRSASTRLRELLAQKRTLVKPGAHNALAARIIEQAGFQCCGVTGYGVSVSLLGRPDVGLTTMSEVVMVARYIAQAVDIPVIADADTGFGNAITAGGFLYEAADTSANLWKLTPSGRP